MCISKQGRHSGDLDLRSVGSVAPPPREVDTQGGAALGQGRAAEVARGPPEAACGQASEALLPHAMRRLVAEGKTTWNARHETTHAAVFWETSGRPASQGGLGCPAACRVIAGHGKASVLRAAWLFTSGGLKEPVISCVLPFLTLHTSACRPFRLPSPFSPVTLHHLEESGSSSQVGLQP